MFSFELAEGAHSVEVFQLRDVKVGVLEAADQVVEAGSSIGRTLGIPTEQEVNGWIF